MAISPARASRRFYIPDALRQMLRSHSSSRVCPRKTRPEDTRVTPGKVALSAQINQQIVAFHLQRKHTHMTAIRRQSVTRPRIKCPRVPRTDHRVALQPSLPQRPSAMWTDILQSRQSPINIRQAHLHALRLGLHHLARLRSLAHRTQPHPLTHSTLQSRPRMRC